MHVPHLLEQLGARDDLVAVEQEMLEELELLGRQLTLGAVHVDLSRESIENDVAARQLLGARRAATSHECAHTRAEFLDDQRLRDVVVRTGVQRAHGARRVARPGEDDDRRGAALLTERLQDTEAMAVR